MAENRALDPTAKRLRWSIGSLAVIVVFVFGVVWLQRTMLFPRSFPRQVPSALETRGLERWWIESPEGDVEAWFLPGVGVDRDHPGPAVIFAHGNGELIDHFAEMLSRYRELGVSLILPEYRGYGRSAGAPSESAIAEDLDALHARMRAHPEIDEDRLVFHGRSLGGGAVCTLVEAHPPRALILESSFTSVVDVAADMYVPSFLIVDRFESLPIVREYEGPLLVFHGVRDQVIPVSHGRTLAAAHGDARLVLYDSGHNDLPPPGSDYWAQIERHLRSAGVIASD